MTSTAEMGPIWVTFYVLAYLAVIFVCCVAVVKGTRWARRTWRRRKGLPDEPDE